MVIKRFLDSGMTMEEIAENGRFRGGAETFESLKMSIFPARFFIGIYPT